MRRSAPGVTRRDSVGSWRARSSCGKGGKPHPRRTRAEIRGAGAKRLVGSHRKRGCAPMHETPAELRNLRVLLDDCRADAGTHLRSIFRDERRMSAAQVVRELAGVFVRHVATVTARGRPMLAPVDGLFYRSRFWIGFPPGSVRGRHLRTRPAVSASYSKGEDVCILVHGEAREVPESVRRTAPSRTTAGSATARRAGTTGPTNITNSERARASRPRSTPGGCMP